MTTWERIEEVEVDSTDRQGLVFTSTSDKCEVTYATLEAYSIVMKVQFDSDDDPSNALKQKSQNSFHGALSLANFVFATTTE